MMQDLNDKIDGNTLSAAEWDQVASEIQAIIESAGITLSGADLGQASKAIAAYVANGNFYVDGGLADAYVLSPVGTKNPPPAYADGMSARFYAGNSNTGAATVNVGGAGVVDIRSSSDVALTAGAISAGKLYEIVYHAAGGWFRLIETPVTLPPEIHSITATVAANQLTITAPPQYVEFRNSTLSNGASVRREIGSTINLVVSNGSTLGTVANAPTRLFVLAIDNVGVVELAIVNPTSYGGGFNLTETGLITTVAEGGAGAADSADVAYSTAARANVAYRVIGFIDITEATAGVWATGPTVVQGAGGNAIEPEAALIAAAGGTETDINTGFETRLQTSNFVAKTRRLFAVASCNVNHNNASATDVIMNFDLIDVTGGGTVVATATAGSTVVGAYSYNGDLFKSISAPIVPGRTYYLRIQLRKTVAVGPTYPRNMRIDTLVQ